MDDQLEAWQRFDIDLRAFNEDLRLAMAALDRHYQDTLPAWDDSVRATLGARIEEARLPVEGYLRAEAEAFEHFIEERIRRLHGYLHGR